MSDSEGSWDKAATDKVSDTGVGLSFLGGLDIGPARRRAPQECGTYSQAGQPALSSSSLTAARVHMPGRDGTGMYSRTAASADIHEAGAQESPRGGSDSLLLVHEGGADQTSAARQEKCLQRAGQWLCVLFSLVGTQRVLSGLRWVGPGISLLRARKRPVGPPPWEQGATTGQTEDATIPCLGLGGSARRSTGGRVLVVNRRSRRQERFCLPVQLPAQQRREERGTLSHMYFASGCSLNLSLTVRRRP